MYRIIYPYLLKVQRNEPNMYIRTFKKYEVMYLILYPYLLQVQRNVPDIISVPSESTT